MNKKIAELKVDINRDPNNGPNTDLVKDLEKLGYVIIETSVSYNIIYYDIAIKKEDE